MVWRPAISVLAATIALAATSAAAAHGGHGVQLVLRATRADGGAASKAQVQLVATIVRRRIARLGARATVVAGGHGTLVVRFPGLTLGASKGVEILAAQGQLALYDLETSVAPPTRTAVPGELVAKRSLAALLSPEQRRPARAYFVVAGARVVAGPLAAQTAAARIAAGAPDRRVLAQPRGTAIVRCSAATAQICPGLASYPQPRATYWYLFGDRPALTGAMLDLGRIRADVDPATNRPIVVIGFTRAGNRAFRDLTRREAIRGRVLAAPQHLAIVLDGQIRSWPQIDYTQLPNGIDPTGSGVQITGLPSAAEAKRVALVLQTGAVPVQFELVSRTAY